MFDLSHTCPERGCGFLSILSWSSCGKDRLLCLHVQQVHPGSPCLSAGQNCEWTQFKSWSLMYKQSIWLYVFVTSRLVRQCPLMLNAMSRRCLGMCWMRSSRPSLSADYVQLPPPFPGCLSPLNATPLLSETQHNHVTKTLQLALSV